jgi:benzoylformate decarboxylase
VLLPELEKATANHRSDYQRRFESAVNEFELSKESLLGQVKEQQSATVITPLVAAFEAARAIGPDVAIVDEAIATSGSLRKSLNSPRADQYAFLRGGGLGWGCLQLWAIHSVWEERLWCALWATALRCTLLRLSGRPHMKNCR